jgi:hypothetical protein
MSVSQVVERIDAFSLDFTQKYGPRYGIWLPASKVWIPWFQEHWDLVAAAILSGRESGGEEDRGRERVGGGGRG